MAFSYQPAPTIGNQPVPAFETIAPVTAPQVAINTGTPDAVKETPVTMSTFMVRESAERRYRDVRDAMAYPDLTAPRALFTKNLSNGTQLEALCAPIDRTWSETVIGGLQPRFPLVGFNF